MKLAIHRFIAISVLMFGSLTVSAQSPMPDRVVAGSRKSYWVDSTLNPGTIYQWAIDGVVIRSGLTCCFTYTWNCPGVFELTLRQFSAEGCESLPMTGRVVVDYPAGSGIRIFPNPATGTEISIHQDSGTGSIFSFDLYASDGQFIGRLFEGCSPPGANRRIMYPENLSQGIYLYQIKTENQTFTGRIILLRQY